MTSLTNSPSDLLDVPALAELLGLSEAGVRAMIRRGELPTVKIGRRYMVRRSSFDRHLRNLEADHAKQIEDRTVETKVMVEEEKGRRKKWTKAELKALSTRGRR